MDHQSKQNRAGTRDGSLYNRGPSLLSTGTGGMRGWLVNGVAAVYECSGKWHHSIISGSDNMILRLDTREAL